MNQKRRGLEDYIKKSQERLISAVSYSISNIKTTNTGKQKLEEKHVYKYFKLLTARLHTRWHEYGYERETSREKLNLSNSSKKNNAIRINYIKVNIEDMQ